MFQTWSRVIILLKLKELTQVHIWVRLLKFKVCYIYTRKKAHQTFRLKSKHV